MLETVFRAILADAPKRGVEVEFRPEHPADFLAALAGQNEQSHDGAEVAGPGEMPGQPQFVGVQHSISGNLVNRLIRADDGVFVGQPLADRPRVEGRQGRAGAICGV